MTKKIEKNRPVVASFKIVWPGGSEPSQRFDKTWQRVRELAQEFSPVEAKWQGWARIDQ